MGMIGVVWVTVSLILMFFLATVDASEVTKVSHSSKFIFVCFWPIVSVIVLIIAAIDFIGDVFDEYC